MGSVHYLLQWRRPHRSQQVILLRLLRTDQPQNRSCQHDAQQHAYRIGQEIGPFTRASRGACSLQQLHQPTKQRRHHTATNQQSPPRVGWQRSWQRMPWLAMCMGILQPYHQGEHGIHKEMAPLVIERDIRDGLRQRKRIQAQHHNGRHHYEAHSITFPPS